MKTAIALLVGAVLVPSTGLSFTQGYPHAFPRPGAIKVSGSSCAGGRSG